MRDGAIRTGACAYERQGMNEVGARLIEVRLEAAFDRFNRAGVAGIEPTLALFMDALEAEGLRLSLSEPDPGDRQTATPSIIRTPEVNAPQRSASSAAWRANGS